MTDSTIVKTLWASGFVNRWHSNPDPRLRCSNDTTAAHSHRVSVLVDLLYDSMDEHWQLSTKAQAVRAALLHDAAENYTGDAPYGAKRDSRISAAMQCGERDWWEREMGDDGPEMTPIVKLCDQIDAIMFCGHVAPDLLERDDWRAHEELVMDFASQLGLRDIVEDLISV